MCPLHARHRLRRRGERGPSSDKEGDPDVDATVRVGSQTADLSFSFRTPRQPGEAPMDPDGSPWVQVRAALGKGGGGWGPAESRPHRGPAPLRPCPTEAPPHCSSTPLRPRPHSSSAPVAAPPLLRPPPHGSGLLTDTLQSARVEKKPPARSCVCTWDTRRTNGDAWREDNAADSAQAASLLLSVWKRKL